MHVPNFKTNVMYDRATDLLFEVYSETENLEEQKALVLRWRSVHITEKVTRAIIESNKNMKMKLLNEAKEQLVALLDESYVMHNANLVVGNMIDDCGERLLKLIHYQFGQMKNFREEH